MSSSKDGSVAQQAQRKKHSHYINRKENHQFKTIQVWEFRICLEFVFEIFLINKKTVLTEFTVNFA